MVGGLHLDEDGDQVYWKALFGERQAPIRSGSATVRLPGSLAGQINDYRSFGGAASSRRLDPRTVEFTLHSSLPPGRALEVQVAFPHGLLNAATPQWQKGTTARVFGGLLDRAAPQGLEETGTAAWGFGGLCLLLVVLLVIFRERWRRAWPSPVYPKLTAPVTVPPSGLFQLPELLPLANLRIVGCILSHCTWPLG